MAIARIIYSERIWEFMRNQRNMDIRVYARQCDVWLWEVAERIGSTDFKLSRALRHELSADEKTALIRVIDEIAAEGARSE